MKFYINLYLLINFTTTFFMCSCICSPVFFFKILFGITGIPIFSPVFTGYRPLFASLNCVVLMKYWFYSVSFVNRGRQTCGRCGRRPQAVSSHSGRLCTNRNSEILHFTFWVIGKFIKTASNNQNSIAVHSIHIATNNIDSELFSTVNNQLFPHPVQTITLIRVNYVWCHLLTETEKTYCKNHTVVFWSSSFEQIM